MHFYVYKLPEGLGMKKILAYSISMQKNSPTKEGVFWIFTDFYGAMRVQSPT